MLPEIQVSEIHCCTCFFALDYTSPASKGIYFKKTQLKVIQELREEETQPHPKEPLHFTWVFSYHEKNFKAKYNSKGRFRKRGCFCLALG